MAFRSFGGQCQKGLFSKRAGPLQRQLSKGEYGLFRYSPMFESDFVQITKQGGPVEIHNKAHIVTMGITTSNPLLVIPDVLLVAQPVYLSEDLPVLHNTKHKHGRKVGRELSRLFPLRLVKISIHAAERQQLKLKLASGRTFYLQLCPESSQRQELFDAWARMIQLLWPHSETKFEPPEFEHIRRPPPPRPKAPPPKLTTVSMTAWSDRPNCCPKPREKQWEKENQQGQ